MNYESETRSTLKRIIPQFQTIVVGEMHGIKENTSFIKALVKFIKAQNIGFIAFEYPHSLQGKINSLPQTKRELSDNSLIKMMEEDGRFSKYHMELLTWLREKGIKILCIDPSKENRNMRDNHMYKLFSTEKKEKGKEHIAIVGNLHAERRPVEIEGKKCKPFASYLDKHLTILLKYGKGKLYNFKTKHLPEYKSDTQLKRVGEHTFEFFIPHAHPTK